MRIYIYSYRLSGKGGMETVLATVSRGLMSRGHDVKILLAGPSEDAQWECGLPVYHLMTGVQDEPRRLTGDGLLKVQAMLLLNAFNRSGVPDVIVTTETWVTAVARAVADRFENRPKVLSWLHFSLHIFPGKHWLHQADAHIAISDGNRQQLSALCKTIPTYLVHNPVDTSVALVERSLTSQFLYVGRVFNPQKRIDRLFTALSRTSGEWGLTIIGDGPDRDSLEDLACMLGIESRVRWMGWQADPWASVTEASALILPSDFEGFGLVLIEALARGIPVISSDCMTGPRDIINSGENGWLFSLPGDDDLLEIIRNIVEGHVSLPSADVCKASVDKFDTRFFLESFESAIFQCVTKQSVLM